MVLREGSLEQQLQYLLGLVRNANCHHLFTLSKSDGAAQESAFPPATWIVSDPHQSVRTTGLAGVLGGLVFSFDTSHSATKQDCDKDRMTECQFY